MKKISLIILALLLITSSASAFWNDTKVLTKEELVKLSDDKLIETYIDAKIEVNASKTFHDRAGFNSPKEYEKFKELLVYIVQLRQEMMKRDLPAPPVDEWLR